MSTKTARQPQQWLARLGYAGLLFFTLKGLLWLMLPVLFAWYLN
jgi:hypothetical protein